MAILRSHHIALKVHDVAVSKAFYTETLGFPIVDQFPGRETYFIDIGGTTIELGQTSAAPEDEPSTGFVHLAFEVDDVFATCAELEAKGVAFYTGPAKVGDLLSMAFFRDPDGNALELFQSERFTWA